MKRFLKQCGRLILAGLLASGPWRAVFVAASEPSLRFDEVVYGGTASGAAAAVQGARMGKKVALLVDGKQIANRRDFGPLEADLP